MGELELLNNETEPWTLIPRGDDIPVHVSCEGEGEVFEEDGIVEIPAVGDGIDDGVGDGVGFEEAGTAIDADGFGGGVFREADTARAGCDSDAFDIGEFEDAVVGVVKIDFVGGIRVPLVRDFEETRGPGFAGKRTGFDGAGADNVVGHVLRGGGCEAVLWSPAN